MINISDINPEEVKLIKHAKAVADFIYREKREPTAIDFDKDPNLPRARTIQRVYGGLPKFREALELKVTDFTKGTARIKKAKKAMDISNSLETELFLKLRKKYKNDVSSPSRIFLNSAKTADFRIDTDGKIYLIDVFYPTSKESFQGCVNIKNKKYDTNQESCYVDCDVEFLLVCLNESVIDPNKKTNIKVLSKSDFYKKFMLE